MLEASLAGTVQMRVIILFHVKATGCFHIFIALQCNFN